MTNTAWLQIIQKVAGPQFASDWGPALVGPSVEETLKGLGLVVIFLTARAEFDDVFDGFVYGAVIGLGFAAVEDLHYFVRLSEANDQIGGVLYLYWIRVISAGLYGHVLYTGLVGMGFAYFVSRRDQPYRRRLQIGVGAFALAWLAHFIWNSPIFSFLIGDGSLLNWFITATIKGLPIFIAFAFLVYLAQKREARWFAYATARETGTDILSTGEVQQLSDLRTRRAARRTMRARKGPIAEKLLGRLQREQINLAMVRTRVDHEEHPDLVRQRQLIRQLRAELAAVPDLPPPATPAAYAPPGTPTGLPGAGPAGAAGSGTSAPTAGLPGYAPATEGQATPWTAGATGATGSPAAGGTPWSPAPMGPTQSAAPQASAPWSAAPSPAAETPTGSLWSAPPTSPAVEPERGPSVTDDSPEVIELGPGAADATSPDPRPADAGPVEQADTFTSPSGAVDETATATPRATLDTRPVQPSEDAGRDPTALTTPRTRYCALTPTGPRRSHPRSWDAAQPATHEPEPVAGYESQRITASEADTARIEPDVVDADSGVGSAAGDVDEGLAAQPGHRVDAAGSPAGGPGQATPWTRPSDAAAAFPSTPAERPASQPSSPIRSTSLFSSAPSGGAPRGPSQASTGDQAAWQSQPTPQRPAASERPAASDQRHADDAPSDDARYQRPAAATPEPAQPAPAAVWAPTHLVPAGGMQAWATPDPSRPPIAMLAERLDLRVIERAADWAHVVASNGWTGWVDGRRLIGIGG
jgi:hypothetical protein